VTKGVSVLAVTDKAMQAPGGTPFCLGGEVEPRYIRPADAPPSAGKKWGLAMSTGKRKRNDKGER